MKTFQPKLGSRSISYSLGIATLAVFAIQSARHHPTVHAQEKDSTQESSSTCTEYV